VSAYSLVALTRAALPLTAGSSILTLSYYGAEKVVANYNVMGVAKAALEACVRFGRGLGPRDPRQRHQRRSRARSASGTWASAACTASSGTWRRCDATSTSRTSVVPPYLSSGMAAAVTGEVHYVDAGFNVLGSRPPRLTRPRAGHAKRPGGNETPEGTAAP
jgi:enoyl-[acyl-carrier protein] reductase I